MSSVGSARSVMVCYACVYCPYGTSDKVLRLIHWVLHCWDIGKHSITCFQQNLHYRFMVICSHFSDIAKWLRFGASCSPDRNGNVLLLYTHTCSIHRFLLVVQVLCQYLPFFIANQCKSFIYPKFIVLVFYLLLINCYFSIIECFCPHKMQKGFRSENIGRDFFRCSVDLSH